MGWFRGKRFSVAETIGLVSTGILLIQLGDGFAREGSAGAADKGASPLDYMRVELGAINGLKGPHLIIEGANVHVRSGGGSTTEGACWDTGCSGLGNLIIGYDEPYANYKRTGIHNLVVGTKHGFRSHGGFVAGSHNQINQPYATVAGGQLNTVSAIWGSIAGGKNNWVSGNGAAILGGRFNHASGAQSTVSGGGGASYAEANHAAGDLSAVTGGSGHVESDPYGVDGATRLTEFVDIDRNTLNGLPGPHVIVEGANLHVRSGVGSTDEDDCNTLGPACSGLGNLVVGYDEPEYGEPLLGRQGAHNLVVGGNHGYDSYGGFVAGNANKIAGRSPSVAGGTLNLAKYNQNSVCGGAGNESRGAQSVVAGGHNNVTSGQYATVSGGEDNAASGTKASVSGGYSNEASAAGSSVTGGYNNAATGNYSTVLGGGGPNFLEGNATLNAYATVVGDVNRVFRDIEGAGTKLH